MTLTAIFLIVFLVGPLVFQWLTAPAPSPRNLRLLALFSVACFVAALGVQYFEAPQAEAQLWVTGIWAALLWVAWIGVVALVVQALRRADPRVAMRRWSAVIGVVGSTVPWFGLAFAALMRG